ncbi:MAG: response regulator [Acidobacteria bacterium]|nr:response regulator [Acidobacteriota bacterium]
MTSEIGRVVIVDDDPDVRAFLAAVLRAANYSVRAATDGWTALRILRGFAADIVLLDLRLPGTSGFEVAHELRHSLDMPRVPIIAISGDEHGVELATANPDFFAVLVKPIAPDVLLATVNAASKQRLT